MLTSAGLALRECTTFRLVTIIVQVDQSCTVTGPWRSMDTTGQRIEFPFCDIFRFDSEGRIVHAEAYYDMRSIRRQLGYE